MTKKMGSVPIKAACLQMERLEGMRGLSQAQPQHPRQNLRHDADRRVRTDALLIVTASSVSDNFGKLSPSR